jgi:hypothetical protein
MIKRSSLFFLSLFLPISLFAQIGEYRNEFAVGVNGGVTMSSLGFVPEIPQNQLWGKTFGITLRYTGEKYFKSICALVAEVNYAEIGWEESILNRQDQPVINSQTELAEEYRRIVNYVQVPLFARLGWGRERRGFQAFFQVGPQIGYYLSEKTDANFDIDNPMVFERVSHISGPNVQQNGETFYYSNMYHMSVENKLDYGIAAGLGLEFSHRHLGHFMVEGRYYFGLGNIYGNSKRDYFAKSNYYNIVIKAAYLFDIVKSKNPKIK